jgi:hypothetical protein
MILTFLPLLLVYLSWWLYRNESVNLAGWRKGLFLTGIAANAVSAAVLISFTIHAYVASKGTKPVDLDRLYPVFSMFGLALLTAGLTSSGKRVSRLIFLGTGLFTAVLWYFVALAASP